MGSTAYAEDDRSAPMLVGHAAMSKHVPDDRALPMEVTKLQAGSPEAKVAMLQNMLSQSKLFYNYFPLLKWRNSLWSASQLQIH